MILFTKGMILETNILKSVVQTKIWDETQNIGNFQSSTKCFEQNHLKTFLVETNIASSSWWLKLNPF